VRLSRAQTLGDAPGANAVIGRVSAIEYQGTWLKITIDEACGEEFVANVPDNIFFADALKVGDVVLAQWDAQEVHFLDGRGAARVSSPQSQPAPAIVST
jgi:putative spermidine/putrescine transport system ATP-binding protein